MKSVGEMLKQDDVYVSHPWADFTPTSFLKIAFLFLIMLGELRGLLIVTQRFGGLLLFHRQRCTVQATVQGVMIQL